MAEKRSTAWFATRSRRPGTTRAELEEMLASSADLNPIMVELARSAADLVDSAKRSQDPRLWLSASARLVGVLGRLGLVPRDRVGDQDEAGAADGFSGVAEVVGGAPEVRDPAEP